MDTDKLKTFLILAEELSFTKAADILYCSQPSVSMQIQSLEKELDVKLFDRIGKKIYLTDSGKVFKQYAEQMKNTAKEAKEQLKQYNSLEYGNLSFGASHFVGVYMLTKALTSFHKKYPKVKINMQINKSEKLIHQLSVNELELLVVSDHIYMDEKDYASEIFFEDELILVVNKHHPFTKRKNIELNQLLQETVLIKPKKSATRQFIEKKIPNFDLEKLTHIEISSSEGIKRGVIHGLGVSFLSRLIVSEELKDGTLVEVPVKNYEFKRNIQYIYNRRKNLSPAIKEFIKFLNEKSNTFTE